MNEDIDVLNGNNGKESLKKKKTKQEVHSPSMEWDASMGSSLSPRDTRSHACCRSGSAWCTLPSHLSTSDLL